jgi:hypothetical protein
MDSLILDIGGNVGALVIHTGPQLIETEIEISPHGSVTRSHNVVHARRARHGVTYSAVFPSVPAGKYTIWRHDDTPQGCVTIHGGQVTEHHWD